MRAIFFILLILVTGCKQNRIYLSHSETICVASNRKFTSIQVNGDNLHGNVYVENITKSGRLDIYLILRAKIPLTLNSSRISVSPTSAPDSTVNDLMWGQWVNNEFSLYGWAVDSFPVFAEEHKGEYTLTLYKTIEDYKPLTEIELDICLFYSLNGVSYSYNKSLQLVSERMVRPLTFPQDFRSH